MQITEILNDENKGIEWLYRNFGRKLVGYAINTYSVTEDIGWDLVYKTIYRVVEVHNGYKFETEAKLGSFIFTIFINYLKNFLRDEKTKANGVVFVPIDENRTYVAKPAVNTKNDKLNMLNYELSLLEDWQRILLLMRSQGASYSEIAAFVNKPEDQLKVYYQRLKNKITEKLIKEVETEKKQVRNVG